MPILDQHIKGSGRAEGVVGRVGSGNSLSKNYPKKLHSEDMDTKAVHSYS